MKKTEIITLSIALIGLIMSLFLVTGASILLVLSLSTIAVFYQYLSFALMHEVPLKLAFKKESYPENSGKFIALAVLSGIALSFGAVGAMFKLLHWPGANVILLSAIGTNLAIFIASFLLSKGKSLVVIKNIRKRSAFAFLFCGGLFYFGSYLFLDFKYRAYPNYLEAVKAFQNNPNNEGLRTKMEDEKMKMFQQ